MTIQELYDKYTIPPHLQMHMYRVAAVAKIVSDNFLREVDKDEIVTADLLHDMGNIVEIDFSFMPEEFEEKGLDYWKAVKESFIKKYGKDKHEAKDKIAEEIGVSDRVMDLIKCIGSSRAAEMARSRDYSMKIVNYADFRVTPEGVTTVRKRVLEGRERFKFNNQKVKADEQKISQIINAGAMLENQLQNYYPYDISKIDDKQVKPIIVNLKSFKPILK